MEKEKACCEVRASGTGDGFRIEAKGDGAKQMLKAWKSGRCCAPLKAGASQ